jgi:hypothetical protein
VFVAALAIVAAAYYGTNVSRVTLFWSVLRNFSENCPACVNRSQRRLRE